MRPISTTELQNIQLDILKEVHNFCVASHLRYSLSSGTLIGAIRHDGFIPWDDDIDIMMPRPDYEAFIQNFHHDYLEVMDYSKDSNYPFTYGKVYDRRTILKEKASKTWENSVYIDVFVIDGLGEDLQKAQAHYRQIRKIRDILTVKIVQLSSNRNFIRNLELMVLKVLISCLPYHSIQKRIIKMMKKFNFENSEYAGNLNFGNENRIFKRSMYESLTTHKFEDASFFILKDYETYLSKVYGDYMQLPPEEKRVTHHAFEAWWKE